MKEVVNSIMHSTPHAWPSHSLHNFPPVLVEMLSETTVSKENSAQLKKSVEEEWRSWGTMSNENDIIQHFSSSQVIINTAGKFENFVKMTPKTIRPKTSATFPPMIIALYKMKPMILGQQQSVSLSAVEDDPGDG